MKKRQFASDAAATTGATSTPTVRTVRILPTKDSDLLTVAQSVDTKWQANPALTLLWMDEPTFKTMVNSYGTNLGARLSVGSNRPSQTLTLAQVNAQIDSAVDSVKSYIVKKFKKANASAQYARYGIVKEGNVYRLPRDNDKRKIALPLMTAAIVADGFGAEEFGTAFWTSTSTNFSAALKTTTDAAKNISNKVAGKDSDKSKIKKVLNAIIALIKANYPDTSDKVLREWGFIKQNY